MPDGKTPEGQEKTIRVESLVTAETMADVVNYLALDLDDPGIEVETICQIGYAIADIPKKKE